MTGKSISHALLRRRSANPPRSKASADRRASLRPVQRMTICLSACTGYNERTANGTVIRRAILAIVVARITPRTSSDIDSPGALRLTMA